ELFFLFGIKSKGIGIIKFINGIVTLILFSNLMEFGMNTLKVITSFCFAIIFSASASAQEKIQILVLGTSHYNEEKDSLEYKEVIDKLTDFNPDMVMGEFVSPQEYVSLEPDSYRRKVNDSTFYYYQHLHSAVTPNKKKLYIAVARQ